MDLHAQSNHTNANADKTPNFTFKEWAGGKVGTIKIKVQVCRDFLGWFDKVKEQRNPTELEKFIA